MDEDSTYEYSETFDSLVSSSSNIKSVETELDSHDSSTHNHRADAECLSQLSTERSGKWWTASHQSVERTASLSESWSKLRFSRHFSESENYSADFESRSSGSRDESDEEASTVCSVASDTDTQTCSSVSQETSVRWQNDDESDDFFSDSQHLSSPHSHNVFSSTEAGDAATSDANAQQESNHLKSPRVHATDFQHSPSVAASVEEKNFVRRKLLHLSHQKWLSAAEGESVEDDSVIPQQTTKTSAIADARNFADLGGYFHTKIDHLWKQDNNAVEQTVVRDASSSYKQHARTSLSDYNIPQSVLDRLRLQNLLDRIEKACHVHDRQSCEACREEDDKLTLVEYLTSKCAFINEQLTSDNYERHLLSLVTSCLKVIKVQEAWVHYAHLLNEHMLFANDARLLWNRLLKPLMDQRHHSQQTYIKSADISLKLL